MKTKLLQKIHKQIPKRKEKIHKKVYLQKEVFISSLYESQNRKNIYVSHKIFHSLEKHAKKIFSMPLHQTDINRFKSDLFLLQYGTLELMCHEL